MFIKLSILTLFTSSALLSETLVKFDFDNGLFHDVVKGADLQSYWAIPTNEKVGFIPDWDGNNTYTLSNDGTKPTYYGGSYGNAHRAEWGLTYNESNRGNELSIGGNKKGNIKDGFSIQDGVFTIKLNINDWSLFSEEDNVSIIFKARTKDNITVAGFKLTGDVSSGHTTIQGITYSPKGIHGKPLGELSSIIKQDSLSGDLNDVSGSIGISIDYENQSYTVFANGESTTVDAIDNFSGIVIEKVRLSTENFSLPNFITFDDVSFVKN